MGNEKMNEPGGEIILYQNDDGSIKLDVRLVNETMWMTQADMAQLFQCTTDNISLHLKNIFEERELFEEATTEEFSVVRQEGTRQVKRQLTFYNLDAIISVGYRVKSLIATRFRIWATQQLKEYIIKGFVMDDERLKNPEISGASKIPDYFDEMLQRIRDIRASERRMYLRVREIFSMATDYEPSTKETVSFFQTIQNKLHFASTGMTAAELIHNRAKHEQPNMGLSTWKSEQVRKSDVTIAKNYLKENEVSELNRIVVMWLDYAEDQAKRRKQIFMTDWQQKLDSFLEFNERQVLDNAGSITKKDADSYAKLEYDHFDQQRRLEAEQQGYEDTIKALEDLSKKRDS